MNRREMIRAGLAASAAMMAEGAARSQTGCGREGPAVLRAAEISAEAGFAGAGDDEVSVGGAGAGSESDGDRAGGRV